MTSRRAGTWLADDRLDRSARYERLAGKLYFLIDPANKRNQVIADLEKARRNSDGKVEMSADLVIWRPRDLSRGNGMALFDIVNRGGTVALTIFDGPVTNTPEGEVGDGFLLNRGYTIVQVGWEFDARREGAIRVDLPEAVGVSGLVRATFIPSNRNPTTVGDLVGYAPSDPASPQNTLRVRAKLGAEWVTIPRAKWTLAGNTVTLEGGFEPGQTYELAYLAHDPPVAGLGFAAVRDAAAWVKYASHDAASARYTIAFGSSQTGRWLRDFLYEGFNADERNRQVFDGVMPHLGGGGGVVLNQRWSTPTSLLMETATHFPFSDKKQRDPVTGIEEGLLENVRAAEHQPKIFYTYSDTEYWERSVALTHTTPDGSKDIVPPSKRAPVPLCQQLAQHRQVSTSRHQRRNSGQSVRLPDFDARVDDGHGKMAARRHGSATQSLPTLAGRHVGPRHRRGVSESSRRNLTTNRLRRGPGTESLVVQRRRQHIPALSRATGRSRRQRRRRPSAAGRHRAARNLHRLELSQQGNRRH